MFGKVVDSVDCPAFVTAGDDQCGLDMRQGVFYDLYEETFPLAGDSRYIDLVAPCEFVDDAVFPQRADQYDLQPNLLSLMVEIWFVSGDMLNICLQVPGGANDSRKILHIHINRRGMLRVRKNKIAMLRRSLDVGILSNSTGSSREAPAEREEQEYRGT